MQELEPKHVPLVLLALYEIATLSRGSSNKQVDPDVGALYVLFYISEIVCFFSTYHRYGNKWTSSYKKAESSQKRYDNWVEFT